MKIFCQRLLDSNTGNKGIELTQKAYYNVYKKEISEGEALGFLNKEISSYSIFYNENREDKASMRNAKNTRFTEIISEVISKNYFTPTEFTNAFVELIGGMLV
ncbi:MAG: hypothetical protein HUJ72_02440 [Blautia sp.]|nr:hypothetical protein [Blautia sp.]